MRVWDNESQLYIINPYPNVFYEEYILNTDDNNFKP